MAEKHPICRSPEILGGMAVFRDTRVPVATLWDYIESGDTLDEFLRQFPTVSREQALAVLELAKDAASRSADEATA